MIPDYCEPLIGYRVWNVFPNGLMCGQSYAEPWPPYQAMAARCGFTKSAEHVHDGCWAAPPVYRCGCGIHALKRIDTAELRVIEESLASRSGYGMTVYTSVYDDYAPPMGRVWGSIKFWGRVIEHEIGYRAEFAYPSQLYCQDPKLAAIVATLYGVPCDVKTLDIPQPQPMPATTMSPALQWYPATPAITWGGNSFATTTNTYWINTTTAPKPAPVQQPGLIQSPSLLAIKALGATDWQKQQATPAPVPDWKAVMAKAFHVKKADPVNVDG